MMDPIQTERFLFSSQHFAGADDRPVES